MSSIPSELTNNLESAPQPESQTQPQSVATPEQGGAKKYIFLAIVSMVSLVSDLGTKWWAEKTLQNMYHFPTPKPVIRDLAIVKEKLHVGFGFVLAKNKGGAWGLLQGASEHVRKPFFVIVSFAAIIFIVYLYRRLHPSQRALRWGLPLVLGGALGNLIDRMRYGFVIDFIDFFATWKGAPHHWPTFNVADIAICVGVALMAIDMLVPRRTISARDVAPESATGTPELKEATDAPAKIE
jgi:signal peptidase II